MEGRPRLRSASTVFLHIREASVLFATTQDPFREIVSGSTFLHAVLGSHGPSTQVPRLNRASGFGKEPGSCAHSTGCFGELWPWPACSGPGAFVRKKDDVRAGLSPNGPCVTYQHSLSQKELKEEAWASTVAPTVTPRPPRLLPRPLWPPRLAQPRSRGPPTGARPRVPCRWARSSAQGRRPLGIWNLRLCQGLAPFSEALTGWDGRSVGGRGSPGSWSEPLPVPTVGALSM